MVLLCSFVPDLKNLYWNLFFFFFPAKHLDATWLLGLKIPDGTGEQSRHCCHRNEMLSQLYAAAIFPLTALPPSL